MHGDWVGVSNPGWFYNMYGVSVWDATIRVSACLGDCKVSAWGDCEGECLGDSEGECLG